MVEKLFSVCCVLTANGDDMPICGDEHVMHDDICETVVDMPELNAVCIFTLYCDCFIMA